MSGNKQPMAAPAAPTADDDADDDFEEFTGADAASAGPINPLAILRQVEGGLGLAGLASATAPTPSAGAAAATPAGDFQDEEGDDAPAPAAAVPVSPAPPTTPAPPTPIAAPVTAQPTPRMPSLATTMVPSTTSANVLQLNDGIQALLQNIVSTVSLGTELDLKDIALKARNAEYNPKRFAAVIMRIREPKTTALIFKSGKMVCTGAKTEDNSKLAAKKYARIIQKLGYPQAKFIDFKVQNIVASCDVKFPIRLEALATNQPLWSKYEPEIFPGLVYRVASPAVVLLIFVSGKIVLTGAKTREDINKALTHVYPVLLTYKKTVPPK